MKIFTNALDVVAGSPNAKLNEHSRAINYYCRICEQGY